MTCSATYGLLAYLTGNSVFSKYLGISYVYPAGELTVVAMAIVGAGLGFLWYNAYPAQVFMGDVGSLSLGGTLGMLAILTKHEILLALVGGIFVLEAVSVILQVWSFKTRGKRIFRMAPIHHHYKSLDGQGEDYRSLDHQRHPRPSGLVHAEVEVGPMNVRGKRVVVVGLGSSGRAAARLALAEGASVVGTDLRSDVAPIPGVEMMLGEHPANLFRSADLVILSPGVPSDQPALNDAREHGVPVVGELGFAADFIDVPMIAITGTNGKSTVTSFVAQLAEEAGLAVFAGGNLGNPLSEAVLADEKFDLLVVEVSSYQLENPGDIPMPRGAEPDPRPPQTSWLCRPMAGRNAAFSMR